MMLILQQEDAKYASLSNRRKKIRSLLEKQKYFHFRQSDRESCDFHRSPSNDIAMSRFTVEYNSNLIVF